jgi:hypothetical protein
MPQDETKLRDGRIVRSERPLNLEMPFKNLGGFQRKGFGHECIAFINVVTL